MTPGLPLRITPECFPGAKLCRSKHCILFVNIDGMVETCLKKALYTQYRDISKSLVLQVTKIGF